MTVPRVSMPAELAQAIHDYLMTRPMGEVEGLVVSIRQAEALPDKSRASPVKDGKQP